MFYFLILFMGKLKDFFSGNFFSSSNDQIGDPDTQIEMENLKQLSDNIKEARGEKIDVPKTEEEMIKEQNNKGAELFIDAYDRTFVFPDKSYVWDKLDEIFSEQKQFTSQIDKQYFDKPFSCYNFDKPDFDLYYDLNCAIEELVEAIRELNTKKWKQNKKIIDKQKILEEIVDCTKFLNQAILRLGYNANDYYDMHKKKSGINTERQKNGY